MTGTWSTTDVPGLDRFGRFTSRDELNALRPKLVQGETVRYALACVGDRKGLLACTDRRILWLSQGPLQVRTATYTFGEIRRIAVEISRDGATITISCPDGDHQFTRADRSLARVFADQVRTVPRLAEYRRVEVNDTGAGEDLPPPRTATTPAHNERAERLERLDRMLEKGSITRPEYNANRRRILENDESVRELGSRTASHEREFAKRVEF